MISSRKTMCTGSRSSGQSAKKTGSIDSPAMGTCTAKMKAMAFLMLSKMRRPRRTAATMEEKSSSSSTSDGRLAGHVGAAAAHGDADVGGLERRGVVDAVAGHGDDLAGWP